MKKLLLLLATSSLIFILTGCEKEDFEVAKHSPPPQTYSLNSNHQDIVNSDQEMILGAKLDNPYSVATMTMAYNNVLANGDYPGPNINIETTHFYLKFKPRDEAERDILVNDAENKDISLYNYPLDYEILTEGLSSDSTFLYCAWPISTLIPNVQYYLLETLYIPENEGPIVLYSTNLGFLDALEDEALRLTGNYEAPTPEPMSSKYRPSGVITVWDDLVNGPIPLVGAKVRSRRWFKTHRGITDSNGRFECDGRFKRAGNYSIIWARAYWSIKDGAIIPALYNGPKKKGEWNLYITGGKSLRFATIHRALHRWFYTKYHSLTPPNHRLKVRYAHKNGPAYGKYNSLGLIWDIAIWGKDNRVFRKTQEIFATTAHEVGHAAHCQHIGVFDYWGTSNFVLESWASCTQWIVTNDEYSRLTTVGKLHTYYSQLLGYQRIGWPERPKPPPTLIVPPIMIVTASETAISINAEVPDWLNRNYNWITGGDVYSPVFIDLIDFSNQREYYQGIGKGGYLNYPDDCIENFPIKELEKLVFKSRGLPSFRNNFKPYIGTHNLVIIPVLQTTWSCTITQEKFDRFFKCY